MTGYSEIYGIGGIGTGVLYALEGNHTLGRNETRLGKKLPVRDFCKLHIITHYLTVILSAGKKDVAVYPIGAVGDDKEGEALLHLFKEYGIKEKYIRVVRGKPTLSSICFQYPDGSGGNITEKESASSTVDIDSVKEGISEASEESSLIFTVPEVPLEVRVLFLETAKEKGIFSAASFLTNEIQQVFTRTSLRMVDLLSINIDEARALLSVNEKKSDYVAKACAEKIFHERPGIQLVITDGGNGLYGFSENKEIFYPAVSVELQNSAGAGDAVFAGLLIGKILGYPFISKSGISSTMLANTLGALSVEAKDTINFTITYEILMRAVSEMIS